MDRSEILQRLKDFVDRIDHIKGLFSSKPDDSREKIMTEYGELRRDLFAERKRVNTVRWRKKATRDETTMYLPAILESASELRVSSGAPPSEEMRSNLYAARLDIDSYLDGLKKKKT